MRTRALAYAIVCAAAVAVVNPAIAHDFRPGIVSLVEPAGGGFGEYVLRIVPPIDNRGEPVELALELPQGCTRSADRVHCAGGLAGPVAVRGLRGDMKAVLVIERAGGREDWILDAQHPSATIGPAPPNRALAWIWIGIDHILGGLDHLAFVIGLLLVLEVTLDRRLLVTITAFTVAHSLTLALAALDVVTVSTAPVEACIAASVVLVAREAMHREPTAIRRLPWLAAGAFGLIHGLGFAAALGVGGLPRASLAWSLLWFNVGVELGQLAVVVAVVGAVWLGRRSIGKRWIVGPHVHRAACYTLGAVGAWWLLERVLDLLRGGG